MIRPRILAWMAIAGTGACALGLAADAHTMMVSYLAIVVTLAAVAMGALGLLMLTYLVRRAWTADLHEPLRAAALMLPVIAVLFMPVLVMTSAIYPWARAGVVSGAFQAVWLTPEFFAFRTVLYFATLSGLAVWAVASYRSDARMTRSASAGLIVYAVIVSLAGVDWLESIEPQFHSSIFGLLFLSGALLSGLAYGLAVILSLDRRHGSLSGYGSLLLAVLLLWVYLHAMQYWIVWSGNLPEEMKWYLERLDGGWGFALWALYLGQFVLPFLALLSDRVRARRTPLLAIAVLTLAMRLLEAVVLLAPPAHVGPLLLVDLAAAGLLSGSLVALAWAAALPDRFNRAVLALPLPYIRSVRRG